MIIISQNKENIINFENVPRIWIGEMPLLSPESREIREIIARTADREAIVLGVYPSLNRAKEVLKEIAKFYYISNDPRIREHDLYEMPKE